MWPGWSIWKENQEKICAAWMNCSVQSFRTLFFPPQPFLCLLYLIKVQIALFTQGCLYFIFQTKQYNQCNITGAVYISYTWNQNYFHIKYTRSSSSRFSNSDLQAHFTASSGMSRSYRNYWHNGGKKARSTKDSREWCLIPTKHERKVASHFSAEFSLENEHFWNRTKHWGLSYWFYSFLFQRRILTEAQRKQLTFKYVPEIPPILELKKKPTFLFKGISVERKSWFIFLYLLPWTSE